MWSEEAPTNPLGRVATRSRAPTARPPARHRVALAGAARELVTADLSRDARREPE